MNIVVAQNIIKSYDNSMVGKIIGGNESQVLKGINLEVQKGDFIGIMGRSGCGKTTLLKILGTIDKASKGDLYYGDRSVKRLTDSELAELRRKKIGFVFQNFNLMNNLSVEENIMLPMVLDGKKYSDMKKITYQNASMLNIERLLKKEPYELSGGEKQRVSVARALSNDPDIIYADEPTGNLDMSSSLGIMKCFCEINDKCQKTIVMVTHDPLTASFCKRIFFLREGVFNGMCEMQGNREEFYNQIVKISSKEELSGFFL